MTLDVTVHCQSPTAALLKVHWRTDKSLAEHGADSLTFIRLVAHVLVYMEHTYLLNLFPKVIERQKNSNF